MAPLTFTQSCIASFSAVFIEFVPPASLPPLAPYYMHEHQYTYLAAPFLTLPTSELSCWGRTFQTLPSSLAALQMASHNSSCGVEQMCTPPAESFETRKRLVSQLANPFGVIQEVTP